jgi:glycine/D-amino acid oxidase-like deaminating enzyme
MIKYGRSPWIDGVPKSRVPSYPRHRGSTTVPVVIVGAGLTGAATAYAFAAAGLDVVVLEANQVSRGTTSTGNGWISADPGVPFAVVDDALGLRAARHGFHAWRRASLDAVTLIRRLGIHCDLHQQSTLSLAQTPEQLAALQRERKTRQAAGIDMPFLRPAAVQSEVGLSASGATRGREGGVFDPYRAAIGLLGIAVKRGAQIYERSPVRRVTFTRRHATVFTAGGSIRTSRIVVTTGNSSTLYRSLDRHFWFRSTYHALTAPIPARIRRLLGKRSTVVRDGAEPPHIVRWVGDDRLLVTGADAAAAPARQQAKLVAQRTMQLMYELSTLYPDISGIMPEYGWEQAYTRTRDGLPYLGPHRNFPHHLFAWGDSSHSATGAFLASRVLLRHHLGEVEPADEVFAFTRYER